MFNSGGAGIDRTARKFAESFHGTVAPLQQVTVNSGETKALPIALTGWQGGASDVAILSNSSGGVRVIALKTRFIRIQARVRFGAVSTLRSIWIRRMSGSFSSPTILDDDLGKIETQAAYATLNLITEPILANAGQHFSLMIYNGGASSFTTVNDPHARIAVEGLGIL